MQCSMNPDWCLSLSGVPALQLAGAGSSMHSPDSAVDR